MTGHAQRCSALSLDAQHPIHSLLIQDAGSLPEAANFARANHEAERCRQIDQQKEQQQQREAAGLQQQWQLLQQQQEQLQEQQRELDVERQRFLQQQEQQQEQLQHQQHFSTEARPELVACH